MAETREHPAVMGEMGEYLQSVALEAQPGTRGEFSYGVIEAAIRIELDEINSVQALGRTLAKRLAASK